MSEIVEWMQQDNTGVPVRCQKIFLTTIPCAFTGYDVVEWLCEKLNIEDSAEAMHLASLLCQYGYLFPVTDTKSLQVRDDGSLYRFQTPAFWPSYNSKPDDVYYAIYLTKRMMRNKQKHGLEDFELIEHARLQKTLCDKWDFIRMQAEEQVKLLKECKKADKVVRDSQERAFWRVRKPGPSQLNAFEEDKKKLAATRPKRKSADFLQREIAFLLKSIDRSRAKCSHSFESLQHHCHQYAEHDPFLTSPQPSNPWISDDSTLWNIDDPNAAVYTEKRMKRWAFSFDELLRDPAGIQEFENYLKKEYSSENIRFWKECEKLRFLPLSKVEKRGEEIFYEFLAKHASSEVNIDGRTMENTRQALKKADRFTFREAQEHIYLLMKKDSYVRFIRGDDYQTLLANAVCPSSRKKFFSFVSTVTAANKKQKTPNLSPSAKRRGSATGLEGKAGNGGLSQHSFSTGNLRELDDRSTKSSPNGSSTDLKDEKEIRRKFSAKSLKQKLDDLVSPKEQKLSVPKNSRGPIVNSNQANDSCGVETIAVPNVVAPWDD
ncbi:DgyrCDS338 [Dimorphilus gyrociliatus]|nr:DgyrCDS338 [Dimorphilus gyrociliatus]